MDQIQDKPFNLMLNRKIYDILDGDCKYGIYHFDGTGDDIPISMPYMSGPDICKFAGSLGMSLNYNSGFGSYSRWEYFQALLKYCIQNDLCEELLKRLFTKGHFEKLLWNQEAKEVDQAHKYFISVIIKEINKILIFRDYELEQIYDRFYIRNKKNSPEIQIPEIKRVDRGYIYETAEKALKDIDQLDYDNAITRSRTLLEEVLIYAIEKRGGVASTSGKINVLSKQFRGLYKLHLNKEMDNCIKSLISGSETILSAIAEMRNKCSDSHGVGAKRITMQDYHVRLFVNISVSLADFILSIEKDS